MPKLFVNHAARIEKAASIDGIWAGLLETLPLISMDFAVYVSVASDFSDPFFRTNLKDIYQESPAKEDPFLNHCCDNYDIFPVGREFSHRYSYISEAEQALIDRAAAQGFKAGLAIPMRLKGNNRFGGFILGNGMDMATFSRKILPRAEELRLFCMIIHRRIEELVETPHETAPPASRAALVSGTLPPAFDVLTPRESEIIVLLSQGKTRAETALACNISVHTVSDYAKQGYRKLGIRNRAQAAAMMMPDNFPT